jgi:outer membrane protein assembly factor BamB
MNRLVALTILSSALLVSSLASAEDFHVPDFLAARAPAEGATVHPPEKWSDTENVAWKRDIPGLAWSSPIVWGKKVFVTTCINTGDTREPKKGLYLEEVDANLYPKPKDIHKYVVYCFDLDTGDVIWEKIAHEGIPAKPHHIKNTLASETPATDGKRIYALFGNLGMFCYDLDGEFQWKYDIEPTDTTYGWGTSMSPVVHKDRVYIVNDNEQQSWLASLDSATGKEIWKVNRESPSNWTTPFVWENEKRTEIVINGKLFARSYDLDGNELWRTQGFSAVAVPRPFEKFGLLYVTSGHVVFGDNRTYVIKPGASGDISPVEGEPTSEFIEWHSEIAPYHPTPLIIGENLYMLFDYGFMRCFNAKTGDEVYKKKRIPGGRAFSSSPVTYAGKIFCINEDGVTFVIPASDEFEVLYKNKLAEDDMGMATPLVLGDKLLIRTSKRLYCIANTK